ncbi:O-acetyltransferase OatA [Arthrobacter saudimassiliensis]|uniref:O-acetyltransferase OatA n=1 Tax=Arthrobacter saudimassiliensis TaxID=1461584 RepID=A0A078MNK6_9MICC|nr:O-acetyltransferase OatA [Arthrobacter saudimassiliensis]
MSALRLQAPARPASGNSDAAARPGYRPEVQGLRALAVVLVVLYHVWLGRVSGGVDIFLLISAFLLTGSFTRRLEAGRPLELARYWARAFKRLVPAAGLVLLAVLAGAAMLLPVSTWSGLFRQGWASLLYVQNWVLANSAVDYYERDNSSASPLQHFWSLSVQGQVFVLWPLLFAATAFAVRRFGLRPRPLLIAVFGVVFAASLAFSVQQTATNQAYAYFDTRTRLWEFALGSLLALLLPYLRLPAAVRGALGWIGLAAMLSCGLVLQVQQQFPGWIALWPLLAAALIIAAGHTGLRWGADRLLAWGPLVKLGDNSYALYLWHWPLLVFSLAWSGQPRAGLAGGAGIILASLVLALLTTRLVERPLRGWHWSEATARRSAVVTAACAALVALPLAGAQAKAHADARQLQQQSIADNPGARVLDPDFEHAASTQALVKPAAANLDSEWARFDGPCPADIAPAEDSVLDGHCQQIGTAEGAEKTILVLGDSHAMQWSAALRPTALANDWHVVTILKMGCRYGAEDPERSAECNAHNAAARDYVLEHRPDAVYTVASVTRESSPDEVLAGGYEDGVRPFAEAGITVLAMRDNPRFEFDMFKCLEANDLDVQACRVPRSGLLAAVSPLESLPGRIPGVKVLDMTDQLCTAEECPGIIGNVAVYMDHDHVTRTYAESTAEVFAERIRAATGWEAEAPEAVLPDSLQE